jgi:hypothetical protein
MDSGPVRLQLEQLDSRILPSSLVFREFPLSPVTAQASLPEAGTPTGYRIYPGTPLAVVGTAGGTYTRAISNPDTGSTYSLTGSAHLDWFGTVQATATIHTLGNVAYGHASGQIFITSSTGSITLGLTGPRQAGFSDLPHGFVYTVTHATGSMAHAGGQGTLTISTNAKGGFSIQFT